jgi:hypothetical protein
MKSQPPMTSDDLRRQADNFVDLADLGNIIGRPQRSANPLPRFVTDPARGSAPSQDDHDQDDED